VSEPLTAYPSPALVILVRDGAIDLLKLSGENIADRTRVERHAATVLHLIRDRLGWTLPYAAVYAEGMPYDEVTIPPPVLEAAILAARDMYMRKDAPFGISGAWSAEGESMRVSGDPLAGVAHLLAPYKYGWGIA
jgi:hypothetical protein